jgi:hypothetical protein
MVWAYWVSNFSENLTNNLRSFFAALPQIEKAYDKYHATLRFGKLRPEACLFNLEMVVDYSYHINNEGFSAKKPWEFVKSTFGPKIYKELIEKDLGGNKIGDDAFRSITR